MLSGKTKELEYQGGWLTSSNSCAISGKRNQQEIIYADICIKEQRAVQDAGAIFTITGVKDISDTALRIAADRMNKSVKDIDSGGSAVCMVMGRLEGDTITLKTMSAGDSFAELYILNADGSIALHKILNTLHQGSILTSYGCLSMTRALGDSDLIRYGLTNTPEIKNYVIQLPVGCSAKVFVYSDAFLPLARKAKGLRGIENYIQEKFSDKKSRSEAMTLDLVKLASQHTDDDTTAVELNITSSEWTCGVVFDGHRERGQEVSNLLAKHCVEHLVNGIEKTASITSTALAFEQLKINPKKIKIIKDEPLSAPVESKKITESKSIDEPKKKHKTSICRIM